MPLLLTVWSSSPSLTARKSDSKPFVAFSLSLCLDVFSWFREVAVLFTLRDAVRWQVFLVSKPRASCILERLYVPAANNTDPTVWNRGVCFVPGKYSLLCE
jgi:hypothetical protein